MAAKGRVLDENGDPIWAEFAADGSVVGDIKLGDSETLATARVISAADYRAYAQAYLDIRDQYGAQSDVLSRIEYESSQFNNPDGNEIVKPSLKADTAGVVVRHEALVYDPSIALVLHESPIALTPLININDTVQSVLLSREGKVILASEHNIGYRVAFYTPKGSTDHFDGDSKVVWKFRYQNNSENPQWGQNDMFGFNDSTDQLWGPMQGVPVWGWFDVGLTNDNGFFEVQGPSRFECTYIPLYWAMAKLRYNVWDPQSRLTGIYLLRHGAACQKTIPGIKFEVDVAIVNGQAVLYNPDGGEIQQDETTVYTYVAPAFDPAPPIEGHIPDIIPDFSDQGLLATISENDINNTDIYIFRVSNGMLITSRKGLAGHEWIPKTSTSAQNGTISYNMLIRAGNGFVTRDTLDTGISGGGRTYTYDTFQQVTNVHESLRPVVADHLRTGEQVKVILVNRATGYIGSGTGIVGEAYYTNADGKEVRSNSVDLYIGPIYLAPPNLKIKAERKFKVDAGMTQGTEYENIIGFEGSGLTSDEVIVVSTEWYDHDGSPLPAELPGYTGRLAKVVAPNQLRATGGQMANFAIKPGKHLQLVQLPQAKIDTDHYYLHVSGESPEGNPDFSEIGAAPDGPLQYRPANYVPVKVPIFDEATTNAQQAAYQAQLQAGATGLTPPEPAYKWVYRPEMQFSVFDLNLDDMQLTDPDSDDPDDNLLDDDLPVISSTIDRLRFIYSLISDDLSVLEPFGPGRTLVFSIGDQEIIATIGPDNELIFENLDDIELLDADDFLALRLYQNGDDANVLWEWAFGIAPEGGPNDVYLFADEPDTEIYVYLPAIARAADDPSEPDKEVTIRWDVSGPNGWVDHAVQTTSNGVFNNILHVSNHAGDQYTVTATIINSQDNFYVEGSSVQIGPFTVLPAKPVYINASASDTQVPADGISETQITAVVTDGYNNPVADGTSVAMRITGDNGEEIETAEIETVDGIAQVDVPVGIIEGTRDIELHASDVAISSITVEATDIGLSVTPQSTTLTAGTNGTTTITATTSNTADGTPVRWTSTLGRIVGQAAIANGQATATLSAAQMPGDGSVMVTVAGQTRIVDVEHQWNGTGVIGKLSHAAIVGDETSDGTTVVDQWEGQGTYTYNTSTNLELHGTANETMRIALGSPLRPNAEPVAEFTLQALDEGTVTAIDGSHQAMAMGNVVEDEETSSLVLDGTAHLLIQDAADLQINDNLVAGIKFRADAFDTSGWPQIGPELKQGPSLIQQGTSSTLAYRLGLVEYNGAVRVEAVVQTDTGIHSVVHTADIQPATVYEAGLRYKNGYLEIEVDGLTINSEIQRVAATGAISNLTESISVGFGFKGAVRSLKISQESSDRLITQFEDGSSTIDITFAADGTANVSIGSSGRLSGFGKTVGVTHASATTTGYCCPQPIRFANNSLGDWLQKLVGVPEAHAEFWTISELGNQQGIATISRESHGWLSSLCDKLSTISDKVVDVAVQVGNVAAMLLGLDDFLTLADTLVKLAAGASDEIDYVETTFAAIGATLTIVEIVSAGTLAPAVEPLKWGMRGFKTAVKALGPQGIKTAFSMAKGLGKVIMDVIKSRGVAGAAFDMIKHSAFTLAHLASDVINAGGNLFRIFVAVVRSPFDFVNWVRTYKFFNRYNGVCLAQGPKYDDFYAYVYANRSGTKSKSSITSVILSTFVGTAIAATPCEAALENAMSLVETTVLATGNADAARRALNEFAQLGAHLQKEIVEIDKLDLVLDNDAIKGIAVMLREGRDKNNVRHIARAIALTGGLSDAVKIDLINRYFKLIGDLDIHHTGTEIGRQLYGDMGKLLYNSATSSYNTGFIKGIFHQLEFLEDLRDAGRSVEAIEKGITTEGVVRRLDVVADGGRRFELKNFTNYEFNNISAVTKGLEKDIAGVMHDATDDVLAERLKNLHFVFRGNTAGASAMIEKMETVGLDMIDKIDYPNAHKVFSDMIASAKNTVEAGTIKTIPDSGELVVFQGKNVPY